MLPGRPVPNLAAWRCTERFSLDALSHFFQRFRLPLPPPSPHSPFFKNWLFSCKSILFHRESSRALTWSLTCATPKTIASLPEPSPFSVVLSKCRGASTVSSSTTSPPSSGRCACALTLNTTSRFTWRLWTERSWTPACCRLLLSASCRADVSRVLSWFKIFHRFFFLFIEFTSDDPLETVPRLPPPPPRCSRGLHAAKKKSLSARTQLQVLCKCRPRSKACSSRPSRRALCSDGRTTDSRERRFSNRFSRRSSFPQTFCRF